MRSRCWLLAPAVGLYVGDVGLTLIGQPGAYWAGDYTTAVEANPVVHPLLVCSPWLFAGVAAVWLAVLSALVIRWQHPVATWVVMVVALAHAIGGASWLTRIGPWGLAAACGYLAVAAQVSAWCWRQAEEQTCGEPGC